MVQIQTSVSRGGAGAGRVQALDLLFKELKSKLKQFYKRNFI